MVRLRTLFGDSSAFLPHLKYSGFYTFLKAAGDKRLGGKTLVVIVVFFMGGFLPCA